MDVWNAGCREGSDYYNRIIKPLQKESLMKLNQQNLKVFKSITQQNEELQQYINDKLNLVNGPNAQQQ